MRLCPLATLDIVNNILYLYGGELHGPEIISLVRSNRLIPKYHTMRVLLEILAGQAGIGW